MAVRKRFLAVGVAACCAILAAGCAQRGGEGPREAVVWPPPPAEPRLVYEGVLRSARSLAPDTRGRRLERFATGRDRRLETPLAKPFDVAARRGLVAVSDTLKGVVFVFDAPQRRLLAFGTQGEGRLARPAGVAMDDRARVYVADAGHGRIAIFDDLGRYLASMAPPQPFSRLSDVAVNAAGDRVYAVDRGGVDSEAHRVVVFDAQGQVVQTIGSRGGQPGQFNLPTQAAVGADGQLYVLDAGNFRIQVFSPQGEFLRSWGQLGDHYGNFARPRGLAVDRGGRVYVTDAAYQNFQIFDGQGRFLLPVGGPGAQGGPGQYLLPAGIAVDERGYVYVVDQLFRKIEVLRLLDGEGATAQSG